MKKYTFKTKPFDHQKKALDLSWKKKNFAYFMEMGTGKTKVAIDNIGILKLQDEIDIVIIAAPKSVYINWETEIETHLSDQISYKIFAWQRDKKPIDDAILDGKLGIYLINIEALSHKSGVKFVKELLLRYRNSMFIVDESTTIKNQGAMRTKSILKIAPQSKYRRVLTGSPVTKSPLDLYTQCAFLSPELLGFTSFYTFRARYAVMDQIRVGNDRYILAPKYYTNLDELEAKLAEFSYRVRKDDCLQLPKKNRYIREIDLTAEQQKTYDELKQRALAIVEDDQVSFNNKLTELLRLHQVTCGFVKGDSGLVQPFKKCPKTEELMNIIDETDSKVIIWANYIYDIEHIVKILKKEYGEDSVVQYYGAIDAEKRQKNIVQFQDPNSPVRFFVGNPQTGGYGITLTAANTVIYYSNGYDLEKRLQSEDRAHRIGQKKSVTYIDLIAEGTVDEKIVKALRKKINIASEILGEELKEWI